MAVHAGLGKAALATRAHNGITYDVTFGLDDRGLWERYARMTYLYGRWDRTFGVWSNDGHGWFDVLPSWDLLDGSGELAMAAETKTEASAASTSASAESEAQQDGDPFMDTPRLWPFHNRTQRGPSSVIDEDSELARLLYVDLIPIDLCRAIAAVSPYQWVALEAAWHIAEFADYIIETTAKFGASFLVLAWHLAKPFERPKSWRLHVARQLASMRANQFLCWLLGTDIAKGAVRVIPRLDRIPRSESTLAVLIKLLTNQAKTDVLMRQSSIAAENLDVLDTWPDWLWSERLIRLLCKRNQPTPLSFVWADELNEYVIGDERQTKLKMYLETSPTVECLMNRIRVEMHDFWWNEDGPYLTPKERLNKPYPDPPFESDLLIPISTPIELRREASVQKNCLLVYEDDIRRKRAYAFKWMLGERLTVLIQINGEALWQIEDCRDASNEKPARRWKRRVVQELRRHLGEKFTYPRN